MRLFTGIGLPPEVVTNLEAAVAQLRPKADIRWSPPGNLHITIKFIGEWPVERLDELKAALQGLAGRHAAPELEIRGFGWFPNPHSPRVFWSGVHDNRRLKDLARDTDSALLPLGIGIEEKPYSPHLTLARIQQPTQLSKIR